MGSAWSTKLRQENGSVLNITPKSFFPFSTWPVLGGKKQWIEMLVVVMKSKVESCISQMYFFYYLILVLYKQKYLKVIGVVLFIQQECGLKKATEPQFSHFHHGWRFHDLHPLFPRVFCHYTPVIKNRGKKSHLNILWNRVLGTTRKHIESNLLNILLTLRKHYSQYFTRLTLQ